MDGKNTYLLLYTPTNIKVHKQLFLLTSHELHNFVVWQITSFCAIESEKEKKKWKLIETFWKYHYSQTSMLHTLFLNICFWLSLSIYKEDSFKTPKLLREREKNKTTKMTKPRTGILDLKTRTRCFTVVKNEFQFTCASGVPILARRSSDLVNCDQSAEAFL